MEPRRDSAASPLPGERAVPGDGRPGPIEHMPSTESDHCRWCANRELLTLRARGEHRVLRCARCGFLTLKTGIDESRLSDSYQDYLPLEATAIARWEREQRP